MRKWNSKCEQILTKKFLIEEYTQNKKPMQQIANEIGCSVTAITNRLKKYNIKIRTQSEAMKGKYTGKNNSGYINGQWCKPHYCIDCGKLLSNYKAKRCRKCFSILLSKKLKNRYVSRKTGRKISESKKGKSIPKEIRKKMGSKGKNNGMFGQKCPNGKRIKYKGILFRSSWETLFAQFLDLYGYKWLYESKRFNLGNITYLPDFYIPEWNCYIEIKGWWRRGRKEKFNLFKKLYPKINIQVLMQKELAELGVL